MSALPIMFIVWAVFAAAFVILMIYRGNLSRYEEDSIYLSDASEHERAAQSDIIRKVNRIQPLVRVFGGAAALLTVSIVSMYVWDAWQKLQ
jgi:hypothetical protein